MTEEANTMTTTGKVSWLGVAVIGFGIGLLTFAIPNGVSKPSNVQIIFLSPTFWPTIIAGALIVLGGFLVLQRVTGTGSENVDDEDAAPVDDGAASWMRLAAMAGLMAGLIWAIPIVGMVWASMLGFVLFAVIVRTPRRYTSLIVAIMLPLFLYGFFNHIAGVAVPQGEFVRLP